MINTQYINLNMTPSGVLPVLHCSQYDVGRPLGVVVYNGSEPVDLSTYTATIEATRTDGTAITAAVITDGTSGVFSTTATMTNVADKYPAQLVLVDAGGRVASLPFVMRIVPAAMDENAEQITEDASLYQQYTSTVQTALSVESSARIAADGALQNAINAEASTRVDADASLQTNITNEAAARQNADSVLQAQINQYITPSSQQPDEVVNARVSAYGITYSNLGTAIRTQVDGLADDTNAVVEFLKGKYDKDIDLEWEQGAITAQGEELSLTTRIRTGYVRIDFFNRVLLYKLNSYQTYTLFYDAEKNVISHDGWNATTPGNMPINAAVYMRIVLRKPNNTEDIAPSDGSNCTANGIYTINPLSVQTVSDNAIADIHSGFFLSSKVTFVKAFLDHAASDLPPVYTTNNIKSAFVVSLPISIAGTTPADAYYQQFLYNNSIKKVYFRVFGFPGGQYTVVRNWESASSAQYLSDKTGIVLGDSISYGLYSYWDGTDKKNSDGLSPDHATTRISDYFAGLCGMSMANIAARGTGYVADTRNLGNALAKANATDFSSYDFVMLCFGINDWIRNAPLGTIADNVEGTVCGNLIRVLQKIYSDNPLCKVVIYTPYNAWGQVAVNQGVNYLYGDETTNYALGTQNTAGYTLQTLIDTIKSVANYYGVTCTGLGDSNVVNRINIKDIMIDGLHPSLDSLPMLAAEMYAQKDFG